MASAPSPRFPHAIASGRYAIQKKLGAGSLGTVYLARDGRSGALVALKILRPDRFSSEAVERFRSEFGAIASMRHPRIASALDFGYTDSGSLPFYTREYIEGTPLPPGPPASIVPAADATPRAFLQPVLDLLEALEYLHAHGLLHLDIHPGNLIVARDPARGSVLIDFGLFPSVESLHRPTSTESFSLLPPELIDAERSSVPADLYLAGRVLLYRLTGETRGEARLPREMPGWGARTTLELERIAAKALSIDPAGRFPSAAAFREALSRSLGADRREPTAPEPPAVFLGRRREIEQVAAALKEAREGRSRVLCVTGARGMGKSRLLSEVRLCAQILGLDAVEVGFRRDIGPDSPLLRALRGAARGRSRTPDWLEPLGAEHGGTPAERARRAARAYFDDDDGRPLVLLLDDLDWADRPSCALVEALMEEAHERRGRGANGRGLALVVSAARILAPAIGRRDVVALHPLAARASRDLLQTLLKPLSVPGAVARGATAAARGSPSRLRQIASALAAEWSRTGEIPPGAGVPELPPGPNSPAAAALARMTGEDRAILRALAVLEAPASAREIAAALMRPVEEVRRLLRRMEARELVDSSGGRSTGGHSSRIYRTCRPELEETMRSEVPADQARIVRKRLARGLERSVRRSLREEENLARYLLRSGETQRGFDQALRVAAMLCGDGCHERAILLLETALREETRPVERLAVLERLSAILEEIGDHPKGAALLEPLLRGASTELPPRDAVRLRRRLGVHLHRSGRAEEALRDFEEAERLADPKHDIEDLIAIDSELAELCTLRGLLDRAEDACRRGLDRLAKLSAGGAAARGDFRERMEVIFYASQGHLHLRRFRLPEACAEFRKALRRSRRFRMPGIRAVILNNFGIALNQLNRFAEACRALREAEKLFLAAGEQRSLILIACNLAVIHAKLGERHEAALQVKRAERLLRHVPGERLEFYTAYCSGVAAGLLGDAEAAVESLARGIALGRKLGDLHLARYGQVALAEVRILMGRYGAAWKDLGPLQREPEKAGPPVLHRMVQSRIALAAALLGRTRGARTALEAAAGCPRSGMQLLDAWNDFFQAIAAVLLGQDGAGPSFLAAQEVFRGLKIEAGERAARLGLLLDGLRREDRPAVERWLAASGREDQKRAPSAHRFLAVAEPLITAEARFFLGDHDEARRKLVEASGAIVGSPFLELDWRIELLRARLSMRSGEIQEARAHLHRAVHTRDLLVGLLPRRDRGRILGERRFRDLERLADRLERSPRLFHAPRGPHDGGSFEGLIGRSRAMVQLFETIDRLRHQTVPVLITGETGTGKELVARAIHRTSERSAGPFFAIHAGSLPLELFEAELFGHEEGAFTGAERTRPGLLEDLAGGTLLLDGVGEFAPEAQGKLLRILDTGRVRRLGGREERSIDVRFLSAAGSDLDANVKSGAFRRDLFHRLAGFEVRIPPLRERREDIEPLARHFLDAHARRLDRPTPALQPDALRLLEAYPWPGNVRELEGTLLRALATASPSRGLGARDMEPLLDAGKANDALEEERFYRDLLDGERSLPEMKVQLERLYLLRLFRKMGGDLKKVMEVLGLRHSHFYSRLKAVGIDVQELRRARPS